MVQNDRPAAPLPEAPVSEQSLQTLLQRNFPERTGFVRRIHAVAKNYFRVNYHLVSEGNVVTESHFVNVTPQGVTELN